VQNSLLAVVDIDTAIVPVQPALAAKIPYKAVLASVHPSGCDVGNADGISPRIDLCVGGLLLIDLADLEVVVVTWTDADAARAADKLLILVEEVDWTDAAPRVRETLGASESNCNADVGNWAWRGAEEAREEG
jgi:hypothetical protein